MPWKRKKAQHAAELSAHQVQIASCLAYCLWGDAKLGDLMHSALTTYSSSLISSALRGGKLRRAVKFDDVLLLTAAIVFDVDILVFDFTSWQLFGRDNVEYRMVRRLQVNSTNANSVKLSVKRIQ